MQMFRPLNERILVQPMEEPRDEGGIILPEGATVEFQYGEVVALGDGAVTPNGSRIPPAVEVGDRIYFEPRGARTLRDLGLVMLTERQIVGVLEDSNVAVPPIA